MKFWRRVVVVCLLAVIPLGTSTTTSPHVHPDHGHGPAHHDGAQAHRHAPDGTAPAGEHDDAVVLAAMSIAAPRALQGIPADSTLWATMPTPAPETPCPVVAMHACLSGDQPPPAGAPLRRLFERGPPR